MLKKKKNNCLKKYIATLFKETSAIMLTTK